jgi:hypothetical protein
MDKRGAQKKLRQQTTCVRTSKRRRVHRQRHLIHRPFITTVTLMVFRPHRILSRLTIVCLLLLWLSAGSFGLATQVTLGNQDTVEGLQHGNLNEKAFVTFAQNEKRDTLRRNTSASSFVTMCPAHVSLSLAEPLTVDPRGQTAHSSPSCPLHQKISIYRL